MTMPTTMPLLPTEQTSRQLAAFKLLADGGYVCLEEVCDCAGAVRHNNGGNYHNTYEFRMDAGCLWKAITSTSDYDPPKEWVEITFGTAIDCIAALAARGLRLVKPRA